VLFVFRRTLLGSSYFTLPDVQILISLLMLLVALIFAVCGRRGLGPTQLRTPAQQLLRGPSLAAAGIAGLGIALPSVDYLAALAVIMASGTAALTQVAVLPMFNVGLRAHGDSVAGLSTGADGNREVGGVAAQLDPIASPRRRCFS
jgi:Sap, sulfolipid-1-addressing protein